MFPLLVSKHIRLVDDERAIPLRALCAVAGHSICKRPCVGASNILPRWFRKILIKVVLRAYGVHYKGIAISVEQVERTSLEIQTL
jgi:hypothetical protein